MAVTYTQKQIDELCQKLKNIDAKKAEELAASFKNGNLSDDFYQKCSVLAQSSSKTSVLKIDQEQGAQNAAENAQNAVVDKDFKKNLREIFQPSAEKQHAEYVEDIKAPEYKAEIKHANGSVDKIVAKSANNISLSSQDKDGNPRMPNMQRFYDIVALAQKQGSVIEFGDIKSPDFKARLMYACMHAKPAMQMIGAPELNAEFLQSIQDDKLKEALQIMKKKKEAPKEKSSQTKNNRTTTPRPMPRQDFGRGGR